MYPRLLPRAEQLDRLYGFYRNTFRRRSPVEAPAALTDAYVDLVFAWGFARAADGRRARRLVEGALPVLADGQDPIHLWISRALCLRVGQALESRSLLTPLPAGLRAELEDLERYARYKVDRFRSTCAIVEPMARLDPVSRFRYGPNAYDELALVLATTAQGVNLDSLFTDAVNKATDQICDNRVQIIECLLDHLLVWNTSASTKIDALVPAIEVLPPGGSSLAVLHKATRLACVLQSRGALVHLSGQLRERLLGDGSGADEPGEPPIAVAGALVECIWALRDRMPEARPVVAQMVERLRALRSADPTISLLIAAAGRDCGRSVSSGALARALGPFCDGDLTVVERTSMVRAIACAASYLAEDLACSVVRQLAGQWMLITDSFGTNSHFCLSVIGAVEPLVLATVEPRLPWWWTVDPRGQGSSPKDHSEIDASDPQFLAEVRAFWETRAEHADGRSRPRTIRMRRVRSEAASDKRS